MEEKDFAYAKINGIEIRMYLDKSQYEKTGDWTVSFGGRANVGLKKGNAWFTFQDFVGMALHAYPQNLED